MDYFKYCRERVLFSLSFDTSTTNKSPLPPPGLILFLLPTSFPFSFVHMPVMNVHRHENLNIVLNVVQEFGTFSKAAHKKMGDSKYVQIQKQELKQEISLAAAWAPYFSTEVGLFCHMTAYQVLHLYRNVGARKFIKPCSFCKSPLFDFYRRTIFCRVLKSYARH
jgi:hypothetical protein